MAYSSPGHKDTLLNMCKLIVLQIFNIPEYENTTYPNTTVDEDTYFCLSLLNDLK